MCWWYYCSSTAEAKHSLVQNHQRLCFAVCCLRHYDYFNMFFCFAIFWNNFQPRENVSKACIAFTGNVTRLLSAILGKQIVRFKQSQYKRHYPNSCVFTSKILSSVCGSNAGRRTNGSGITVFAAKERGRVISFCATR